MAKARSFTFRPGEVLMEQIDRIAAEEDRSRAYVVTRFIEAGLADYAGGLPDRPEKSR